MVSHQFDPFPGFTQMLNQTTSSDNIPQFSQRLYEVQLPEDAPIGTTVVKIEATDADSGDFGRIRFTSINGPLSNEWVFCS